MKSRIERSSVLAAAGKNHINQKYDGRGGEREDDATPVDRIEQQNNRDKAARAP